MRNESETLASLIRTRRFAVNVLHEGQEALADRFARRGDDTWDGVGWFAREGGAPLLEGALATLECGVHDLADGGDHTIAVGQVAVVEHPEDHVPPLVFYRGSYSRLASPPDLTRLPSRLGDLAVQPLDLGFDSVTSVAVLIGRPQGTSGCLIYVHRSCTVGDALRGADCARRRALDAALDRMSAEGAGVVVYHRDDRHSFGGCCLGDQVPDDPIAERMLRLTLERALDQIGLRDVRLLVPRSEIYRTAVSAIDDYVAL